MLSDFLAMIPVTDLEKLFDILFEGAGFKKVSTSIELSPDFNNADYIHFNNKTICELKIIDKNYFKEGGIIDRFASFFPISDTPQKYGEPLLPGLYNFKIPELNRERKHDSFEEPVRRIIKKANRQIKETNARLMNNEGLGCLLLAINMNTPIDIQIVFNLVAELLAHEFSGVDGFIVGSPQLAIHGIYPCCIHGVRTASSDQFEKLCFDLGEYFANFFYNLG